MQSDGTVVAVGSNLFGQLNVDGWSDIEQVASGWMHTAGLECEGTVVAVGKNSYRHCNLFDWSLIHVKNKDLNNGGIIVEDYHKFHKGLGKWEVNKDLILIADSD